jgi:hypothetical protein
MQFCHLLTRSGLTSPQVCLTVSPGSSAFWSSLLVLSVICYVEFPLCWVLTRNTIASRTQQSSPSRGIPYSYKRGSGDRETAV